MEGIFIIVLALLIGIMVGALYLKGSNWMDEQEVGPDTCPICRRVELAEPHDA